MAKREMYAWTSLATTAALLGYYIIRFLGVPEGFTEYVEGTAGIFLQVIGIAVLVELVLDLSGSLGVGGVEKDERDVQIEGKGFRNAYYVLSVAVISVLANVLVSDLIGEATGERVFMAHPFMTFHALLIVVLVAQITKALTQLYYYRTGV